MITLQGRACGKLNLTLDILGRRSDGYHDLEMVMCSVSLCDEVTVALDTGEPWSVTCDRPGIPEGEGNLCWKAAKAYLDAADLAPDGVSVTGEFLAALGSIVATEHYRLEVKSDIFAEPPERKPWEKR